MFRFFLRLYFFVHGKTMILHAMVSIKKSNAYNIRFFSLKPLYCKKLFLSENFLLKMASVKLATVTLSRSPNIREKLNCVLEETNRHSNTAIKIVGDVNETIGHTPDGLSKVVAPALKKKKIRAFSWGWSDWTSSWCSEGKWTLGGGIEVPCIYWFYDPKKYKAEFRNELSK